MVNTRPSKERMYRDYWVVHLTVTEQKLFQQSEEKIKINYGVDWKYRNVRLHNNYSFLFCLLDVCGQSIIRGNEKLFIELLSNGRDARNVARNFDDPEPDDPSSNSKAYLLAWLLV